MSITLLRRDVDELARVANADLASLWAEVKTAAQARDSLLDALPALVQTYGSAAATVAADWYDEERVKAGVRGRFEASPVEPVGDAGSDALARWGVAPLFGEPPDWDAAKVLIAGGLQRRLANAARGTITTASVDDPQATGWQRAGSGGCHFCAMLIGRGAVYTEASADFASHDHCHCSAVPAFRGKPVPVKPYVPTTRNVTDADRARVREYLATH